LLGDDILGADRETSLDDAYWKAFDDITADPRNRLIVADVKGQIAGTMQLTVIAGLSRHGLTRASIFVGPSLIGKRQVIIVTVLTDGGKAEAELRKPSY
jgi:hypothetical protein